MSFHFYRIDSLANEERLLREKLKMENQIRKNRERNRHSRTAQSLRYSRMLEPVTNSLEELKNIQKSPAVKPHREENLIDLDDDDDDDGNDTSLLTKPLMSDNLKDIEVDDEKPGELYLQAINSIPQRYLDDGVFGLNIETGTIGNNAFSVSGNRLSIQNKDSIKHLDIDEYDLWRLLLVQRPASIGLDLKSVEGQKILKEYIAIVNDLDLVSDASHRSGKSKNRKDQQQQYKTRAKFKLLQHGLKGSGFLFSVRPPPFIKNKNKKNVFHPSTIVIPSDKKGLLRALLQAVAELRAGNTSMQNIVVPLAQEAKRKKILSRNLVYPDEMTWVFA